MVWGAGLAALAGIIQFTLQFSIGLEKSSKVWRDLSAVFLGNAFGKAVFKPRLEKQWNVDKDNRAVPAFQSGKLFEQFAEDKGVEYAFKPFPCLCVGKDFFGQLFPVIRAELVFHALFDLRFPVQLRDYFVAVDGFKPFAFKAFEDSRLAARYAAGQSDGLHARIVFAEKRKSRRHRPEPSRPAGACATCSGTASLRSGLAGAKPRRIFATRFWLFAKKRPF